MHPLLRLMRLHKPIGIWLLVFPAAWGVLMAQQASPDWRLLFMMLVGAVVTRSAGCIINDLTDRDLDGAVARTKTRPLVTGEVTKPQALALLMVLLSIALVLVTQLPIRVFYLSLIALPMIVAYPWMKRITWWPQAFLGITFNLGALMGWAATGQPLTAAAILLYIAGVFWTLGYDTIYAIQDQDDDAKIGIKSTARRLGARLPMAVSLWYGGMLTCLIAAGALAGMGPGFLIGIMGIAGHLLWQVRQLRKPGIGAAAGGLFLKNQWLGLWLLITMIADRVLF